MADQPDPDPIETDVVVIGGGPVGENVADRVRRGDLEVVVVEEHLVGGECSYTACIPSKALLRGAVALDAARAVQGAADQITGGVDAAGTFARRDRFIAHSDDGGQVDWLEEAGIGLVRGRGRIAGPRAVEVSRADGTRQRIVARHAVVLATGTRPSMPPIEGLADSRPWTNRDSTRASEVPERLVVLGSGPVGCEQALAYKKLGCASVVVVDRGSAPLARHEPFVGEMVRDGLRAAGIDWRLGRQATAVARRGDGPFGVTIAPSAGTAGTAGTTGPDGTSSAGGGPDDTEVLEADRLLVALGRTPNSDDLGVDDAVIDGRGFVGPVGPDGRVTGVEGGWLYAVGDINGEVLLTHMGKYQARACGDAIAARARGELDDDVARWSPFAATAQPMGAPQVVFTEPEVAAVGLTEAEARHRGIDVQVVEYEIGDVSGASLIADGYAGHAKMIVDRDRRVMVGLTLVGPGVGEVIHAATVAIVGEVPLERLWHATPSFPTMSELYLRLLETAGL